MDYTELLPPLPEPTLEDVPYELWGQNVSADMFTTEQVRAAQLAAIAAAAPAIRRAERERCEAAVLAERLDQIPDNDGDVGYQAAVNHCAAAIRALPEEL